MAPAHSPGMSLADLARVLARHWRLSAGFFVATVLITLAVHWLLPRSYRSEGKLYIRLGRESASLDPTAIIGRPAQGALLTSGRENEINSVTEILQSRVLLERVAEAVGPQFIIAGTDPSNTPAAPADSNRADASSLVASKPSDSAGQHSSQTASLAEADWRETPTQLQRAIARLQGMIQVQAVKKSDVVRVTCDSHSPRLSQKIVASLIDSYLAEHLRLNRTPGAHEFLERQTAQMREKLTRAGEGLRRLKDQTGLASSDVQRELMVTRSGRLEDELLTNAAMLAGTEAEVELLREQVGTLPKTTVTASTVGIPNHAAELMRKELYGLQMLEQELSSKYTDEHFAVQQARQRAAEAKRVFDAEQASHDQVTSGPHAVHDQIQLALVKQEPVLKSLRAKGDALRSQLARVREEIKTFNGNELQISQLTRDLKRDEANYEAYAQHLEQTRIDQALETGRISSINIIQPASFEPNAVGPRFLIDLCLGLLVGLIGAIGLPLIVESRDLPLQNPRDIEDRLGVPVLATIPRFRSEQLFDNGKTS